MPDQAKVLQPLANALTYHLGVTGTIALFAAAVAAIVSWSTDLARFRETSPLAPSAKDELKPDMSAVITTLVAILAPATISPIITQLQTALSVFTK